MPAQVLTQKTELSDLPLILQLSIEKAAAGLQSGNFTSVDLTRAYLARIDEASEFKAVLQVNPDALTAAQLAARRRAASVWGQKVIAGPILRFISF